jgi:hypothetical protein
MLVANDGAVLNTKDPEPVSSDTAEARLAEEGVAKNVATPEPRPETPVEIGSPVQFVRVPEVGVPRTGVTSVGVLDSTTEPVPVEVVTPVPPEATGRAEASVREVRCVIAAPTSVPLL